LLLTAGLMAVAALWLLARIRFPERPVTPNPVPSVLSQLASVPKYDDLSAEIARLQARLQPSLVALDLRSPAGVPGPSPRTAAIRLRDDVAVTWVPSGSSRGQWNDVPIVARDAASGLAVIRVPNSLSSAPPVPWAPRQPQQPRYFAATDVSPEGVSLRPAFVGSLDPIESPLWSEPVWAVPERTDLAAGSFLFTNGAELAGLVINYRGGLAIVTGVTVLAEGERLLAAPPGPAGAIGIEVQDLTPAVASATAAATGVIVSWVDPDGASSEQLTVGDVIEGIDDRALATRQQWDVRVARLSAGQTLRLRVRRGGEVREVALVANAVAAPPASRSLGLTLRARTRIGAEVVRIEPGSAADRAGLAIGDVITLVGELSSPTPAQVMRSYTSMAQGQRVIVAVTRGEAHFVTTFER
jgi:S1-C subfamily serine protease